MTITLDKQAIVARAAPKLTVRKSRFYGTGGALFGIQIVNFCLTVLTLGIYSAWGKAKLRRWLYAQIEFMGQRFAYHGTGKEIFIGHLKLLAVGIVIGLIAVATTFAARAAFGPGAQAVSTLVIYLLIYALLPFAMVAGRRYAMSRISWQGIHFSFRGQTKPFAWIFLKGLLVTVFTLGIGTPYLLATMRRYMVSNTYFGDQAFSYTGDGKVLCEELLLAVLLAPFTFGLSFVWYSVTAYRYDLLHTRFGPLRFKTTMTGRTLLWQGFVNMLMFYGTLGLATPWVMIRYINFTLAHTKIGGDLDLQAILQAAKSATATGDALADMFGLDADLAL